MDQRDPVQPASLDEVLTKVGRLCSLQTQRLDADPDHPPAQYRTQHMLYSRLERGLQMVAVQDDALATIHQWMLDLAHPRRVLVLGSPGVGKTFLLQQLALRLAPGPVVPLLLDLRRPERLRSLDELLWLHLASMDPSDEGALRHLLAEGRLALLFDGLDELAERAGDEVALRLLHVVSEAAAVGHAKVVLTCSPVRLDSPHLAAALIEIAGPALPVTVLRASAADETTPGVEGTR